jgi:hypothetical protein
MKLALSVRPLAVACAAAGLILIAPFSAAQPPGGGPAPAGRGNAAPTGVVASPAQRSAVQQMEAGFAALATAVTNARTAVAQASLAAPADIPAKVTALAEAELKLAQARADALAALQAGPNRLNEAQVASLRNRAATAGAGGRGGIGGGFDTVPGGDEGFVTIFDGKTLNGWDGAADLWTVEDGAITARNGGIVGTTYLIYAGGKVRDFELKLEYRMQGGNTGLQYRSRRNGGIAEGHGGHLPDETPEAARGRPGATPTPPFGRGRAGADAFAKWDLGGYQFDLGGQNTGQLYEQDGRGIIITAGNVGELLPSIARAGARIIGTIANTANVEKPGEWNSVHLIARGNSLTHILNGQLMMQAYDNDPDYFAAEGNIGVQIEGSGLVQFRNIRLKRY